MIVVDEEHDGSFKQEEGVRYHARDVALVRVRSARGRCACSARRRRASSTRLHAQSAGSYKLLSLTQRPTARPMPAVDIVDLRTLRAGWRCDAVSAAVRRDRRRRSRRAIRRSCSSTGAGSRRSCCAAVAATRFAARTARCR